MHKKLLSEASPEVLKDFLFKMFDSLRDNNREMYEELEIELYKDVHGPHFVDWMLEKATRNMINEDGTIGAHWTVQQTNDVARNLGINFKEYNEYDWNYTMNMIYSDYYGAVQDDATVYAKMAKKFLQDKDSKDGKALCYYLAMRNY